MRHLKIIKHITNCEEQSLNKYFQEIGKIDLITREEEIQLTQKIKQGDQKALDKFIKANLRFVVSVAKQYQNQGVLLSDLINEGNLGLIKAAKRFDETRGFKFISYAVWWIRQSIINAILVNANTVKLPISKLHKKTKLQSTYSSLSHQLERFPTAEEIAQVLGWKAIDVVEIFNGSQEISLDTPIGDDNEEYTLMNVLSQEDSEHADHILSYTQSLHQEIARSLSLLTPRESNILRMFYGIGKTACSIQTIGEELGISDTMVKNLIERALARLRTTNRSKNLKEFLG